MYVISDGNRYIGQLESDYAIVDNYDSALKFTKLKSAKKVQRGMDKSIRQMNFQVRRADEGGTTLRNDVNAIDIMAKIDELNSFANQIEQRTARLNEQLRKVDLAIVDIEHAAEFGNLNAYQGYMIYKRLHNARVKRREIKNELEQMRYITHCSINSSSISTLRKRIGGMESRTYSNRVTQEEFELITQ